MAFLPTTINAVSPKTAQCFSLFSSMSQHEVLLCQQYAARVPVHQPFSRLIGSWCWLSDSTSVSIPSPGVHGHLQPSPMTGPSEWHISDPVVILYCTYCTYQFFAISLYHASLFLNKQQTQVIQLRQKNYKVHYTVSQKKTRHLTHVHNFTK